MHGRETPTESARVGIPATPASCLTMLLSVTSASPFTSRVRRLPEHAAAIAFETTCRCQTQAGGTVVTKPVTSTGEGGEHGASCLL